MEARGLTKSQKQRAEIARDYFNQRKTKTKTVKQRLNSEHRELDLYLSSHQLTDEERLARIDEFKHEQNMRLRSSRRKMRLSDFEILRTIGRGAFGEVCLVKYKETGEVYAMKIMLKEVLMNKDQVEHIRAERDVMTVADKQWVVTLYYSFQDDDNLYMIMDFCSGGDMMGLLIRKDIFSEAATKFFIAEMILSISSLHKIGYVHRDLKPDNFLLTSHGHVKLTDMGLCKKLDHTLTLVHYRNSIEAEASILNETQRATHRSRELAYSRVGTADYAAPEVFTNEGYDQSVDWWSLGVIMFEMLAGYPPFAADDPASTCHKIRHWKRYFRITDSMRAMCTPECLDFIVKLVADAENRLGKNGVEEIMNHPWLKDVDWDHLIEQKAPYVPDYGYDLEEVLHRIERTPSTAPEFSQLVNAVTCNFEAFPERPIDGRPYGQKLFAFSRKGVSEFIGYTFKRDSVSSAAEVTQGPATFVDPVKDIDLLDK